VSKNTNLLVENTALEPLKLRYFKFALYLKEDGFVTASGNSF